MTTTDQPYVLFKQALDAQAKNNTNQAIHQYQQLLKIDPEYPGALNNLGIALCNHKKLDEGCRILDQALVQSKKAYHSALNNLATGLIYAKKPQLAIPYLKSACDLKKDNILLRKLAIAYAQADYLNESLQCYLEIGSDLSHDCGYHKEISVVYEYLGESESALAHCRRALALEPDDADAHVNLAITLLRMGKFKEAWPHYERRLAIEARKYGQHIREFNAPVWQGEPLDGKRIVIHGEQGLGDNIQYLRFLASLKALGAYTIFVVPYEVALLFKQSDLIDQLISPDEPTKVFAFQHSDIDHDYHIPLMSLSHRLKTDLQTIPLRQRCLMADQEKSKFWADHLGLPSGIRVGLCWRGNPEHDNDQRRSMKASQFKPLLSIPGINYYSLQYKPLSGELESLGDKVINLRSKIKDMSDTAAIIDNLDLVITVDTSVAHLAGALGKKVWILLPFSPDWRWLVNRDDSPWYASARLFRQTSRNNWDGVINQVASALKLEIDGV